MKGNGAVQPLLFTMGILLSEVVEQITTSSLPFFLTSTETVTVCLYIFVVGRKELSCVYV